MATLLHRSAGLALFVLALLGSSDGPAHAQVCGRVDGAAAAPEASDALAALQAAVRLPARCRLCLCDVDGSGAIATTDALLILNRSVGIDVAFDCAPCGCAVPERLDMGRHPRVVRPADLNGDGLLDLVSADDESPQVSVRLALGGGRFGEPVGFDTAGGPLSVTVADVVAGPELDLVVANNMPSSIALLAGNGDGTFESPITLASGNAPINVAVGDLDGDGRNDLVAAASLSNDLTTYRQDGDGTFTRVADIPVGTGPRWVELADLDGDGNLDAAVANRDSDDLSLLPGTGDASFGTEIRVAVCDGPYQAMPADLNGDGTADLVVPCKFDDEVAVMIGLGDFAYDGPRVSAAGKFPMAVAVADMDADGNADAVVSNLMGSRSPSPAPQVQVLLGDGAGGLTLFQGSSSERKPRGVAAADLTGDGIVDAVSAVSKTDDLALFPGRGDGRVARIEQVTFGGNLRDVRTADVDGDGELDLLTVNWESFSGWYRGLGDGRFAGGGELELDRFPSRVAAGDFDGDGRTDVIAKNNKVPASEPGKRCTDPHLGFLRQNEDGTFAPEVRLPATNLTGHTEDDFAVADVDGDAITDIVLVERRSAVLSVLMGRAGDLPEVRQRIVADETAALVTLSDVNGDGLPDVLYRTGAGSDVVGVNLKDPERPGRFLLPATRTRLDGTFDWMVVGDVDADGVPELVAGADAELSVSVHPVRPDGSVGPATTTDVGLAFARAPVLFDVDRDGALDLIGIPGERRGSTVAVSRGEEVVVLAGDGAGGFELTRGFSSASPDPSVRQGSTVTAFAVADLDADPVGDIVVGFRTNGRSLSNVLPGAGHCLRAPGD